MADLINYGRVTDDGARVLAHLRGLCEAADRNPDRLAVNALSGHVGHFYVNVYKMHLMTEADWLRSYPNAGNAVYLELTALEEAKAKEQAQAEQTTVLAESLEALKAQLVDALDRLAKLEGAEKPVEPTPETDPSPVAESKPRKGKRVAVPEPDADEDEAEDAETEA